MFESLNMITRMLLNKFISQNQNVSQAPDAIIMATLPQLIEEDVQQLERILQDLLTQTRSHHRA